MHDLEVVAGGIFLSELTMHNTPDDCWMELHGGVYNLTSYDHPGSDLCAAFRRGTVRRQLAGSIISDQNLTARFDSASSPPHPLTFLDIVANFRLGALVIDPSPNAGLAQTVAPSEVPTAAPNLDPLALPTAPSTEYPSPEPTSKPRTTQGITMAEVMRHNTVGDCGVAHYDLAFNLTDYNHFGPPLCVEGKAGTNLTAVLETANALPTHNLELLTSESMSAYFLGVIPSFNSRRSHNDSYSCARIYSKQSHKSRLKPGSYRPTFN